MDSIEAALNAVRKFLGPTLFGALLSSFSMIILRQMPPKAAIASAISSMLLAVVLAPPLAQMTAHQFGVELESSLTMWGALIALLGRDGIISILGRWFRK